MACEAARKHVLSALRDNPGLTVNETWDRVRWWTYDTIKEALNDLVRGGVAVTAGDVYWVASAFK